MAYMYIGPSWDRDCEKQIWERFGTVVDGVVFLVFFRISKNAFKQTRVFGKSVVIHTFLMSSFFNLLLGQSG